MIMHMTEPAERYTSPSQDAEYEQLMEEYWQEVATANEHYDERLHNGLTETQAQLSLGRMRTSDARSFIGEAFHEQAEGRMKPLDTMYERFQEVATAPDKQALETAAQLFNVREYLAAYQHIDDSVETPAARRMLRTAMDHFTAAKLDEMLAWMKPHTQKYNAVATLTAYDFIREFASNEDVQLAMFAKVDAAVSDAIEFHDEVHKPASTPLMQKEKTEFIDRVASSGLSWQLLRTANDDAVLKTVRRTVNAGPKHFAEAERVIVDYGTEPSQKILREFLEYGKRRFEAQHAVGAQAVGDIAPEATPSE
jgi:hypothetical protein